MAPFRRWISAVALTLPLAAPAGAHDSATPYNGSGLNPLGFRDRGGLGLGSIWLSSVEEVGATHRAQPPGPATGSGLESVLFLGLGGVVRPGLLLTGPVRGELLCLPPFVQMGYSPTGLHRILIPSDPALIGREFCVQAAVVRRAPAGGGWLELRNALVLRFLGDHCHGKGDCGG